MNAACFSNFAPKAPWSAAACSAVLKLGLMQIIANNWAIHRGASKLAHSIGLAFDKKHAVLAGGKVGIAVSHATELIKDIIRLTIHDSCGPCPNRLQAQFVIASLEYLHPI